MSSAATAVDSPCTVCVPSVVRAADNCGVDSHTLAQAVDVVLLDWSQSDGKLAATPLVLGPLAEWSKPTVLFSSAGLLIAGQWQVIGGAG